MCGEKVPVLKNLLYFMIGLGSFLLTAGGIQCLVPWPEEYGVREKFGYFAANKDVYHGLFFGSSEVYRSFVPPIIEEELDRQGVEARLFNFGNPAMGSFEMDYLLKEALSLRPAKLKWVFLELPDWDADIQDVYAYTTRFVHWHSWEETLLAFISAWNHPRGAWEKGILLRDHLLHWIWKLTSYGHGPKIASALLGLDESDPDLNYLEIQGGYRALEDEKGEEFKKRRREFLANPNTFQKRVKNLQKAMERKGTLDAYNLTALGRQIEAIEDAGAEPVFILPPGFRAKPEGPCLLEENRISTLLVYNRPEQYPFLYDPDFHFDIVHLSREGAKRFSTLFARDWARRIRSGGDE
jgi:hypothetical protein